MNIFKDLIDYITKLFTWWVVINPWEQGIRVTLGKKLLLLDKGIWLKLPLIHSIYIQEKRLRVINLPIQTVSTKDGKALTISCSVGYAIQDILKLYNTLYQPDTTIATIVTSKVSEFILTHTLEECNPLELEQYINKEVEKLDYGLKYEYVRIINFASVRTFRFIQDQSWINEGLDITFKR